MTYKPSPRPTFNGPTPIRFDQVARHLWGDEESGRVADWIYVSSSKIHQLVFGLPAGGAFRHSDSYRTVFGADELLYVLEGTMLLANPERGEVHRVETGEAVFFRRDTWHHCFSYGSNPLRVLEFFAPPPSQGASGTYAQTKTNLTEPRYVQDEWLGRWPLAREEVKRSFSMEVIRPSDVLWRLENEDRQILTGLYAATEHLTAGTHELSPGSRSDVQTHGGDETIYILKGTGFIFLPENDGERWFELNPRDGFFIPEGVPHQYYNLGKEVVHLLFAVAPHYQPD